MKVIHAFKAKMEAFRDKSSPKMKNITFLLHLTLNFLDRDENGFLASSTPKPCANQCFYLHFARKSFVHSNRDFTCSLLVKNPMEFQ